MPDPIFICGPTASGKSALAIQFALRLCGEIISVDSMQVYRGMDLGTAKPTAAERALAPHHLVDILELEEAFDAAKFVEFARRAEAGITERGRRPIYCGGTGFYFKALLEGVGNAPPGNPVLRGEIEKIPLSMLLAELEQTDPVTFSRIDRQNPRRVVRAIEVIRLTGKPFSAQQAAWKVKTDPNGQPASRPLLFGLRRSDTDLRERIAHRVNTMFEGGLVAETERLMGLGLSTNPTAMQAIGYRQVIEHLRGERSFADTISLVKTKTWQFARRQMTWFRRQLPVRWIEIPAGEIGDDVIAEVTRQANE
ncbi:MAG: tRNA (adenosine(37)-N6)-dimethylallyltransferase MiaA [Pedosphaera sp.]|nr:tRNA (adenosine(37)-N6)-dimethylallyltransferase MiaA [Pedosphaera sp.]